MPLPRMNFESAEPQTLDEIRDWHRGIVDAMFDQSASVLKQIDVMDNNIIRRYRECLPARHWVPLLFCHFSNP